jgi:hypothetical protein
LTRFSPSPAARRPKASLAESARKNLPRGALDRPCSRADEKHRGFGGIDASHSLGNCCASPLPRPSGLGRLQCQDGRGRGVGGEGAARLPSAPSPQPLSPAAVCFAMVFVPKAGERGVRAQRFSDEHPLWFSSQHALALSPRPCRPCNRPANAGGGREDKAGKRNMLIENQTGGQ